MYWKFFINGWGLIYSFLRCKDPRFHRIVDVLPVKAEHKGERINKDEGLQNKLAMDGTIQPAGFQTLCSDADSLVNISCSVLAPPKCRTPCRTTFDYWPHQTLFENNIIVINGMLEVLINLILPRLN